MLAKRSIALTAAALLPEPILRREHIADSLLARDVLADAQQQASQLLALEQEKAQRLQQQALTQFWESANRLLAELQSQREVLQEQAMCAVEALLSESLRQLLDDTTLAERARAVVRNLAASQLNEALATLSVNPDMAEPVAEWLAESRFAEHWQLKRDATIAVGSLRLSDANGAFDIDWTNLRNGLLGDESSD
ncbi:type III secretion system stator protein SctL [Pseudomonas syringae]|uniref:HrpE/YscL family type III secretion apparatus protein n=2 Tax=Pseudomonas syringae TaxID=317 RepID=A0A9Q4A4H7_PSESX|nr:type III secretion system stator protein SctL [Pseudomonas syringae]MCF5467669.1 HrpE/YscL family type III secretion apparatus protein [Pseudomonas syringae]MCF5474601.1 HrpE/YscL family type III secretion apparatus protein [Pseudomonas syringae]MCF5484119.1 HrpE/YscL family type III secretion apparatus protein [Pseudomonas syringae]MCF5487894.1 HrpE/YscL family type III secretion apparatus protein [Pseudomonas syringae]MCF5494780.1 HrpE/YscL family type III secretion apparatus protein [Pse